jgi:regulator of extracellular matrix RemA (YlzA/DUF370 family)
MSNKDKIILGSSEDQLVNIGHNNFVLSNRILAIVETGPLPSKRLREQASSQNRLIDGTAGRKMRSLVITDSNHVFISALTPATLLERMQGPRTRPTKAQYELLEGEFVS